MAHARYHSMQEIQRPTSAASGLGAPHAAPGYAYAGRASIPSVSVPGPRHYSIGHSESVPSMQTMPGAMPLNGGNPLLAFNSLSVDSAPVRASSPAASSSYHQANPRRASSSESSRPTGVAGAASTSPPALNVPLPDMASLGNTRERALASGDEKRKLAWAKSVIKFVERKHDASKITDPALVRFTDEAISIVSSSLIRQQSCLSANAHALADHASCIVRSTRHGSAVPARRSSGHRLISHVPSQGSEISVQRL